MFKANILKIICLVFIVTILGSCSLVSEPPEEVTDYGNKVQKPYLSLQSGQLDTVPQIVNFRCSTPDVKYFYTIDGTIPNKGSLSATFYEITKSVTINLIAVKDNHVDSDVYSGHFTYTATTPNNDSSLGSINYNYGILSPNFKSNVYDYTLSIPVDVSQVLINPITNNAATIIEEGSVISAVNSQENLITINTIAEDGVSKSMYSIRIKTINANNWQQADIVGKTHRRRWLNFAMSDNGNTILATSINDYLYISYDSGSSWQELTELGMKDWWRKGIKMSGCGNVIYAPYNNYMSTTASSIVSKDGGRSWSQSYANSMESFYDVSISRDGIFYSIRKTSMYDYEVFKSIDYGITWSKVVTAGVGTWKKIQCSDDGRIVYITEGNNSVLVSTDYGQTWTKKEVITFGNISDISISSDGNSVLVFDDRDHAAYISSDIGLTWRSVSTYFSGSCRAVKLSRDGRSILAVSRVRGTYDNYNILYKSDVNSTYWQEIHKDYYAKDNFNLIFASSKDYSKFIYPLDSSLVLYPNLYTNGGSTWSEVNNIGRREWKGLSISGSGEKQVAIYSGENKDEDGGLYYSSDFGVTWEKKLQPVGESLGDIDISNNGEHIAVLKHSTSNQVFYVSHNSGLNWSQYYIEVSYKYDELVISNDGRTILASSTEGNHTIISRDGGRTWNTLASTRYLNSISISSDGSKIVGFIQNNIWLSLDGGINWRTIEYAYIGRIECIDISENGEFITYIYDNNETSKIYTSNDFGYTWNEEILPQTNNKYTKVKVSNDGQGIIALATDPEGITKWSNPSKVYFSFNGGIEWSISNRLDSTIVDIDSSDDFSFISAVGCYGKGVFTTR